MVSRNNVPNPPFSLPPYTFVEVLGMGGYGVVQRMKHSETGKEVAIKFVLPVNVDEKIEREILVHRRLRHPCIPRLLEVRLTSTHLAIVMEVIDAKTLLQNLQNMPSHRFKNERQARFIFHQLVAIVSYLHSQGICHRDLSANNVLLKWVQHSAGARPYPLVYVIDFGMSKKLDLHSMPNSYLGTPDFAPPELLDMTAISTNKQYDGQKADVWSICVVLLVMLTGGSPFQDPIYPGNMQRLYERIRKGAFHVPPGVTISEGCLDFMRWALKTNPIERPNIQQLQLHPWMQEDRDVAARCYEIDQVERCTTQAAQTEADMTQIIHQARMLAHQLM